MKLSKIDEATLYLLFTVSDFEPITLPVLQQITGTLFSLGLYLKNINGELIDGERKFFKELSTKESTIIQRHPRLLIDLAIITGKLNPRSWILGLHLRVSNLLYKGLVKYITVADESSYQLNSEFMVEIIARIELLQSQLPKLEDEFKIRVKEQSLEERIVTKGF